jgi:hypothetical protein
MPMPPLASAAELRSWMQSVEDRLTRLEGRRDVVVGGWVLAEDDDGQVVATQVSTGTTVVLAP